VGGGSEPLDGIVARRATIPSSVSAKSADADYQSQQKFFIFIKAGDKKFPVN